MKIIMEIRERKRREGKDVPEELPTPFSFKARMYPDPNYWRNAIIEHIKQYGNKLVIKEILEKSLSE